MSCRISEESSKRRKRVVEGNARHEIERKRNRERGGERIGRVGVRQREPNGRRRGDVRSAGGLRAENRRAADT